MAKTEKAMITPAKYDDYSKNAYFLPHRQYQRENIT